MTRTDNGKSARVRSRRWGSMPPIIGNARCIVGEIRNKIRNAAQGLKGKIKGSSGRATGDRSLQAKGKTDRAKAKTKKLAGARRRPPALATFSLMKWCRQTRCPVASPTVISG